MRYLNLFWINIKNQPDIWFFYGFVLTFTLSVRKILLYFPINGAFNEYTGIYLYLSDLFLILTIVSWIIFILCHNKHYLSMYKLGISTIKHSLYPLFQKCSAPAPSNVPRGTICLGWNILIPLLMVIWSFISISWSVNQEIAIFRSIKLLEFFLLYLHLIIRFVPFVVSNIKMFHVEQFSTPSIKNSTEKCSTPTPSNVPRGTICLGWNIFLVTIIGLGSFQAIIAIIQTVLQHSIGLLWLKESIISPNIPGVAKIVINGEKHIRAYGLFPHPNILGGFLLFSIIITFLYIKMIRVCPAKCSTWNILSGVEQKHGKNVPRGTFLIYAALFTQTIALFLSFSKSAILALIIALLYLYVSNEAKTWPKCSTWNIPRVRIFVLSLLIVLFLFLIISPDLNSFLFKSLEERILYLNISSGTILAHPLIGVGMGQFVINMQQYSPALLESWQYQPVHNVFLLIWSEQGFIGLVLFLLLLYNIIYVTKSQSTMKLDFIKNVPRGTFMTKETTKYLQTILIGFIFIMLWDHYSWDIQQGQAALWMLLGLAAGIKCV